MSSCLATSISLESNHFQNHSKRASPFKKGSLLGIRFLYQVLVIASIVISLSGQQQALSQTDGNPVNQWLQKLRSHDERVRLTAAYALKGVHDNSQPELSALLQALS